MRLDPDLIPEEMKRVDAQTPAFSSLLKESLGAVSVSGFCVEPRVLVSRVSDQQAAAAATHAESIGAASVTAAISAFLLDIRVTNGAADLPGPNRPAIITTVAAKGRTLIAVTPCVHR